MKIHSDGNEMGTLLEIKKLCKTFKAGTGEIHALKDLDFSLASGESAVVIGNNGSGKSTLLKIISGIYRQSSGEILFNGTPLFHDDISAKSLIGYQPEDVKLPELVTIDEYVDFVSGIKLPHLPSSKKRNPSMVQKEKIELYDLFDLHDKKELYFNEASLGNRKKAALTGALICNPSLVILDEPTNGLDLKTQSGLFDYLNKRLETGTSILSATHSPDFINETGTARAVCLKSGEPRYCNDKPEIFQMVEVLKAATS